MSMDSEPQKISLADALRGEGSPSAGDKSSNSSSSTSFVNVILPNTAMQQSDTSDTSGTNSSFASKCAAERELLRESNVTESQCTLCKVKMTNARILSCLHVFCEECLKNLILKDHLLSSPANPFLIECPTCKQLTHVGAEGIESLVCDYRHSNLRDLNNVGTEDIPCTSCKGKESAISHCNDCENFLCFGCDNAHNYMRCFEKHRVLRFESLKTSQVPELDKVFNRTIYKPIFCQSHANMHLKHYCLSCQTPVCNFCLNSDHRGETHHCETIAVAEQIIMSDFKELLVTAEEKIDHCRNASAQLNSLRTKLFSEFKELQICINETTSTLSQLLQNICNSTLLHLDNLHSDREIQIINLLQNYSNSLERLKEARKFATNIRDQSNSVEFLYMKPLISSQLINLISNSPVIMPNYTLQFETEPPKYEHNLRAAFGVLRSEVSAVTQDEQFNKSTQVHQCNSQPNGIPAPTGGNCASKNPCLQFTVNHLNEFRFRNFSTTNPYVFNAKALPMQIRFKFGSLGTRKGDFNSPHGFCIGANGEIVVADTNNHRIVVYNQIGTFKTYFGIPGKEQGELWYPRKIALMRNCGKYVICDRGFDRSRMQIFSQCGNFERRILIKYIDIVAGLAVTSNDEIVAVDSVSPTIFVISPDGKLLRWFDCSEYMCEPSDIAISGHEFYVCDFKGHCVAVFREDGKFLYRLGNQNVTCFPNGIDITAPGNLYICDSHGNRFHVACYTKDGILLSEFECSQIKISRCCGLKLTTEGYFITLAKNNHHVLVLNAVQAKLSLNQNQSCIKCAVVCNDDNK